VRTGDDDAVVLGDLRLVRDAMMWALLQRLAGTGVLFLATVDACASGTWLDLPTNLRYDHATMSFRVVPGASRRLTPPIAGVEAVEVSACTDDETAQNSSRRAPDNAEMTDAWRRAVRVGGAGQTILVLVTAAQRQLYTDGFAQDIQLSTMYLASVSRPLSDFASGGQRTVNLRA
jgi:hypothetical protein